MPNTQFYENRAYGFVGGRVGSPRAVPQGAWPTGAGPPGAPKFWGLPAYFRPPLLLPYADWVGKTIRTIFTKWCVRHPNT